MQSKKVKRLVYLSLLSTMAIVLHMFENSLALPLPYGTKLGLANIMSLITIEIFDTKEMCIVNFLRVLVSGLLSGIIFSYPWFISCGGVLLSSLAIFFAKKKFKLPVVSISLISAIFHGLGQILVVMYIFKSTLLFYVIFILFTTSIPTGIFTGLCAVACLKRVNKKTLNI